MVKPAREKFTSPTLYLKHRGLVDEQKLVNTFQEWFNDNKYRTHFPKYKVKAAESEYMMTGERDITEYCKFWIRIHIWMRGMQDVEVVKDGEKVKMKDCYMQLEIEGWFLVDYNKRFKGNKFLQWLQDFYQNYVIKQVWSDVWEDDLLLKQQQLLADLKEVIGTEVS